MQANTALQNVAKQGGD